MVTIDYKEYSQMRDYIEQHCGIALDDGKEYLVESRLDVLLSENNCSSFTEFILKTKVDYSGKIRDRIVDLITTNETLWFRDPKVWEYLKFTTIPLLIDKAEKEGKVRIWSAASSTGQEAYSLLVLIHQALIARGKLDLINNFHILATDISPSAIAQARDAKYDSVVIQRGLPDNIKSRYFKKQDQYWLFDQNLKNHVKFETFNLQDSFAYLGQFDLVLLRYVAIYFAAELKKAVFKKVAKALHKNGILILGATENLREFSNDFDIQCYEKTMINIKK